MDIYGSLMINIPCILFCTGRRINMSDYIINKPDDFELNETLECGQCFHFNKLDENDYVLTAFGHMLHIIQTEKEIVFYDTDEKLYMDLWRNYFDIDRNYGLIKERLLKKDDKLKEAIEAMSGVRILNQEFFETLISFIISQNKQIPHIKKIVADISAKYGDYAGEVKDVPMYTFPDVRKLAKAEVEDLKELKTGFRAPYIYDAVKCVGEGKISYDELIALDSEQGIEKMCQIKGVGNKVASCVSLFALGKRDSFPIDVWIKRIMEYLYFDGNDTSKDVIAAFAKERFGELGGYAQQYLFYYGKTVKMGVANKNKK